MSELRTDVLKDGAGTGSPSFPNGLAQADIADAVNAAGSAPIFACRAWVNFDGTRNVDDTGASTDGQPVLINAAGNVTSVVKNSAGNYTVNFTTAMEDVNYCVTGTLGTSSSDSAHSVKVESFAAGSVTIVCNYSNTVSNGYSQGTNVSCAIFR